MYLATGILLFASTAALRMPIDPVPLSELVQESDLIAIVRCGASELRGDPERFEMKVVDLEIVRTLKGEPMESPKVESINGLACPSPAYYPIGEDVLAFLFENDRGTYSTVGMSYGAKVPTEKGMRTYVDRIQELVALQAKVSIYWRDTPAYIEWLVRCAEFEATRFEGAYELDPRGHWMSDKDISGPTELWGKVNREQKARMLKALLPSKQISYGELCLLYALQNRKDSRIDAFVLRALREGKLNPEVPKTDLNTYMVGRRDVLRNR